MHATVRIHSLLCQTALISQVGSKRCCLPAICKDGNRTSQGMVLVPNFGSCALATGICPKRVSASRQGQVCYFSLVKDSSILHLPDFGSSMFFPRLCRCWAPKQQDRATQMKTNSQRPPNRSYPQKPDRHTRPNVPAYPSPEAPSIGRI